MNKIFSPFLIYPDNQAENVFSIMSTPLNLNNIDDFDFFQKSNQFSDNEEENEEEDDFDFINKNCISSNEEISNFVNIFSFENEPKETFSHIDAENTIKNKDGVSLKKGEISIFSGKNNDKNNNVELNSLNSKDNSLNENKNKSNDINKVDVLNKPIIEYNIDNKKSENNINNKIINKKLKKVKNKWQNLEIDYVKNFQLFSKCTNDSYINEIIKSINKKKKKTKKLFKIYNIDNEDNVKLIGKKRKKKKRCEKPDDIRKKLKSRFHKIFTKKINDNLKAANSEKKFYLMPQIFISNIAKKQNKEAMKMKMKDLLKKNFVEDYKEYKLKNLKANNKKYENNLNTLNYLEENIDIQEKSKFNTIGEMKYFELLDEFFCSKEFEDTVIEESKKKSFEYVKEYVKKARTYAKFFLFCKTN